MEDLIAEGNIGMIKAIKKFNLAYDIKFFRMLYGGFGNRCKPL